MALGCGQTVELPRDYKRTGLVLTCYTHLPEDQSLRQVTHTHSVATVKDEHTDSWATSGTFSRSVGMLTFPSISAHPFRSWLNGFVSDF